VTSATQVPTRREEILALAAGLFATRGFAGSTVREIADAAGILSGSLYHHFDSKESMADEILRAFLDEILADYHAAIAAAEGPVDALRRLVHVAYGALGPHRAAIAVMMNDWNLLVQQPRFAYLRDRADETERLWVGVIADGVAAGAFRADVDPRMIYRFLRDAIWVSVRWFQPDGSTSAHDLADRYCDMLLGGLTRDQGGPT